MRILITGGAGFIGSHIADGALAAGHEVAVLDNLSTGRKENVPKGAHLYEIDLRDRDGVFRTLGTFKPEVVSHQAAQASVVVSVRDPKLDAEVNVIGGLNLLDACTQPGAPTKTFVFASTGGAIYGEVPEGTRADENTRPAPLSPYAISKLAFEQMMNVYRTHRGLSTTVLRYANVYGPRQDPHGEAGVVAIFAAAVREGRTLRINARKTIGDAGCVRDYVYVGDVARANLLAIEGKVPMPVMNVAGGTETSTRELAERLGQGAGKRLALEGGAPRAGDLERSVLDPTACLRVLGSLTSVEQGIASTWDWYVSKV